LASAVPFLRLIVAHLEWPDIGDSPGETRSCAEGLKVFETDRLYHSPSWIIEVHEEKNGRTRRIKNPPPSIGL
jgi:hypothetical protein